MQPRPHVLLVEDDDDVRLTTSLVLEAHGFTVSAVEDGQSALGLISRTVPDVAVVDVAMPGMDGIRLTRLIRAGFGFPIVLLTARDLPSDVIAGLDAGADDYVTKPFDGEVLAARLRAVVRGRSGADVREHRLATEAFGDVVVDRAAHVVTALGDVVALSATEFRLLEYLLDNAGHVVSRTQILQAVWGEADWIDERVVDTNVARLRAKLATDAIKTIRGFGYKLVAG
ncbi:transcriptional regulatory protein CseB [Nocardioides baekrokdamisoli]|uniref:Transcriptional regulatory protein CseB n=1 Tax=Nocardioides baekrokdamisoli TaxID=1804624 RepID=A0A3G9IHX8_9ACTN|nr:response regulator transcription factor [Nocardioides baekrokdamisoli]BBH18600.1 transcriptional regulatory protein CseB [Nocardioides baekrokdamisoli]